MNDSDIRDLFLFVFMLFLILVYIVCVLYDLGII